MSRSRALFANASKISMKKVSTNFQMSLSAKKKLAMADLQGCKLWINFWPEASKELWELVWCYVTVRLVRAVTKFIIGIRDFTWRALLKSRPLSSRASMLLSMAPLMLEAVTWIYVQNNLRAVLCSFFDKAQKLNSTDSTTRLTKLWIYYKVSAAKFLRLWIIWALKWRMLVVKKHICFITSGSTKINDDKW